MVRMEVADSVTLVGTAEPWLETLVASQEEGLVRALHVDEGDRVEKGQVLCELDGTELQLRIAAEKASLEEAEVARRRATRELERQRKLFRIESVSEKAYEDAQFDLEAADKKLARLRADLAVLEDQLSKKRIISPITGFVVSRRALVGQWLGEGDGVATLVKLDPIRVMVPVPERYVSRLKVGDRTRVDFDALPDRPYQGRIAAVVPRADPAARNFPVRVEISNREGIIKGGMLGRVELPVGPSRSALMVPKDALVLLDEGTVVFAVDDRLTRLVPVKTGSAKDSFIEVFGELEVGSKVVVRGNERLVPGQAVEITGTRDGALRNGGQTEPSTPEVRRPSP